MDTSLSNHVNFDNTENKANVSNTSSQVTAGDGIRAVTTGLKDSLAKANLHSNHIKDINKLKDDKHKEQKIKDGKHKIDKHREEKHKHHKDEKKHKEDKVKDKHKEDKLKDKPKVEKSKDEKHKDHKHKDIHNSTGKPKDSQQTSSSSSSSSKLKENHVSHLDSPKVKDGSSLSKITDDGKLKEKINNSSNSINKPKISSSSKPSNVSVNDKSKDHSQRPKDSTSSSKKSEEKKHHSSSSEKLKSSDSSHKKEHLNNKKPDGKEKEHEKHRTEEKKIKDEKKHKEKENHEKLKEHISKHRENDCNSTKDKTKTVQEVKIKTEPTSPMKSPNKGSTPTKSPTKEGSSMKISLKIKEESPSDDDVPLSNPSNQEKYLKAERKIKNSFKNAEVNNRLSSEHVSNKPLKRSSDNDSDEEPFLSRMAKAKKVKVEQKERKRKLDDSDDEPAFKNKKKPVENKRTKDQKDITPSPKKRAKSEQEEKDVWKWWEEEKYDGGIKWKSLEHKGPVFAPPYERLPSDVKFYYDGKHIELSEPAEEVASFYAKMLDHDYTTKDVFNNNFFKDWRKVMTSSEKNLIKDLKKCNFNEMNNYFKVKSEERKNMTKEEKLEIKKKNEEIAKEYGTCIIDGHREKIGNFKIEPPGLFRGRGEHPKMGMLKQRIMPEDVIINCSKNENVPKPPPGHKWKEVRHDNNVTWLACWTENIQGQTKYVMLNASSKLKGEKDWQKYEVARKLKQFADKIREQYKLDWKSKEMKIRQRAVALYFIDKLALRAGNEKEEGETADTVGCCSLRVEHIKLIEKKGNLDYVVEFDFLGKDSIRYQNSVPVEKRVFKNLQLFIENKKPDDDLFDRLNTSILNKHLNELMEGLTAKVFRTFNASKTLQEQLDLLTKPEDSIPGKILAYNRANRAVAILCNHQRAVPKTFGKSMENLQNKIKAKRQQIDECERDCKQLKKDAKRNRSQKDQQLYERKKKALERLLEQLNKLEVQATDKEENKDIALGTSKLNYLDPRITVAWCKKWNVPIEKIYNKTQRDKFRWAIEMAGPEFKF